MTEPHNPFPDTDTLREEPAADPTEPPRERGAWGESAVVNIRVTELVKHRMGTVTRAWKK